MPGCDDDMFDDMDLKEQVAAAIYYETEWSEYHEWDMASETATRWCNQVAASVLSVPALRKKEAL